jgi:hypothetical protein
LATEIVALTPERLPALLRFAERVWTRPRSRAFEHWRYEEPPFHGAFLALRDGECLAAESAFRHPYRVGDEVVDFLEVFDWFSLPELRNAGLGVRIMQRYMREPEPLLLVGGTADTRALLPRLGWKVVAQASRWSRSIGAEVAAAALARRLRVPATLARRLAPLALALGGRVGSPRPPAGGRAIAVTKLGDEALRLERGPIAYGTRPLWTPALLRWLVLGFPGAGHFVPLYFAVDGAIAGFAVLRLYPSEGGCDAEIVDAFAPAPTAELYAWFVAELLVRAAGFGAGRIAASTTCPILAEALRRLRFAESEPSPVQVWWPGREGLPGPLGFVGTTGDMPILPLVERWVGAPPGTR